MVDRGEIDRSEAWQHPRKIHNESSWYRKRYRVRLFCIELAEGDVLILCSDGLSNKVSLKSFFLRFYTGAVLSPPLSVCLTSHYFGERLITYGHSYVKPD
jgi:hypothetical protein